MLGKKLEMNADKTHPMIIGSIAQLQLQESLVVEIDGCLLQESPGKVATLLGYLKMEELLSKLMSRLIALENLLFSYSIPSEEKDSSFFQGI